MKILIVSTRRSIKYFKQLIKELIEIEKDIVIDIICLEKYLLINHNIYDVLIYNTFPDEQCWKFDVDLTPKCDEKFNIFKGLKILLDTYDNGSRDGFARFNDYKIPRIKVNPSYDIIDKINIILIIPYFVYPVYNNPKLEEERIYDIVCAMNTIKMPFVRQNTYEKIKQFKPDNRWLTINEHADRLCRTMINVVPTGNGDSSKSHTDTLAAGALLLAEENIKNIKILPYTDLKDGEHFVSYNLNNICDILNDLLNNRDKLNLVRQAGHDSYCKGYDINKNANQLLKWIKSNILIHEFR